LKIAFDYDDTLDLAYELFSVISNSLISAGHNVYIVTHISPEYKDYRINELKQHNIAYTELVITGDKYYECQKRGIEYIFDDCRNYFKDIAPVYLQVFPIPGPCKRTLEDGYEIELAVFTEPKLSGISTSYNYRAKKPNSKKWSDWKYVYGSGNDLKSQLFNAKSYKELAKLWKRGNLEI
jgi:hypothetical protein